MGQKVHPYGFRLGIIRDWKSRWYEEKNYAKWLHEDLLLKAYIRKKMKHAGISNIEIERARTRLKMNIYTARPGIIIGKKGSGAEELKRALQKMTEAEVTLAIHEVRKAELDAQLVAENVATQLERRVSFRRAMKKAVATAMRFGAKGVRIASAGRLGGSEMGRKEWYREGQVPLHTLRADVQYGLAEAHTTYGVIGVKCWIYKGEVFK
ncbi:MAG: small subunit ribosomal protein S3 [Myxococcota bacterium]